MAVVAYGDGVNCCVSLLLLLLFRETVSWMLLLVSLVCLALFLVEGREAMEHPEAHEAFRAELTGKEKAELGTGAEERVVRRDVV